MTTPVLNFQAMEEFLGDAALVREMMPIFVEGLLETAQRLREIMPSGDLNQVRFVLHDLKSMLGNLHAQAALDQLEQVHTLAKSDDLAGVQASVPHLQALISEAIDAAQAFINQSSS